MQAQHRETPICFQVEELQRIQHSAVAVEEFLNQPWWRAFYGERTLVSFQRDCSEFIAAGGIGVMLTVMRRHLHKATIQEKACRVLALLAESLDMIDMQALVQVQQRQEQQQGRQYKIPWNYIRESNGSDFITAQGLDIILSAMRRHEQRAIIQEHGCRVMTALLRNVNKFENFIDDIRVFLWGEEARQGLSQATTLPSMVDASFVDTILSAMRRHERIASVQEQACMLLEELASNAWISFVILQGGGVRVISTVLQRHRDNDLVTIVANRVLSLLETPK